uniref:Putative ankyrin n=1 Tax=Ixodes ricinus TaxID=34613 RepID=A0A0K8RHC6_IXORI
MKCICSIIMDHGHEGSCSHHTTVPSVHQTLDELDFYKGLLGAAADGDYKKTESLLQKGNDPNQQDSYGYTPLHYSCRQGQARVTELLLRHGAQTDLQTKGGATALHRASHQGHLECVKLLLGKGADCTIVDSDGKTALHKAAENGHEEVCRVLIKKSAGLLTVQDAHGRTALDCASSKHPHLSEVLR